MRFNKHLRLEGEHAFLSPSSYHWINYSESRLTERWTTARAAMLGTAMHEYARAAIESGELSEHRGTLGTFINDAIRYRMKAEQILFYSENCFGTADAITFRYNKLRIHDLKTGVSKASVHQLEVYAALFCLEYGFDPHDIRMEFRIYQNDETQIFDGDPDEIEFIMTKIVSFDKQINLLKMEEAA
jgi:hypothetical protein